MKVFLQFTVLLITSSILLGCYKKDNMDKDSEVNGISSYEAGVLRMKDSLSLIFQRTNFREHPYESEERLRILEKEFRDKQASGEGGDAWSYAKALLEAGRSSDAAYILQKTIDFNPSLSIIDQQSLDIYKMLGIAYLREGEQENCIRNHNEETCLFPVSGNGIHQDKSGSQKAIEVYKKILNAFPDDNETIYLLNLAYQTIGQYPQNVPSEFLLSPDLFESEIAIPRWRNVASHLGIDGNFTSGGTIMDDFDNDGFIDIIVSSWMMNGPIKYFHNNKDGTFSDLTKKAGLGMVTGGLNMIQADYNNDGFLDFLLLRGAWKPYEKWGPEPNSLFRNNGDGTFTDVTFDAGIYTVRPTQTACWIDFNNDGWLDLFIGNESRVPEEQWPSEFYISNKDGTFRDGTKEISLEITTHVKGVVATDYNNDGWQDMYFSNQGRNNFLILNKEGKTFVIDQENDVTKPRFSFPALFFDINQDGWEDLIVLAYDFYGITQLTSEYTRFLLGKEIKTELAAVYVNEKGLFTNRAEEYGLDYPLFGMGVNFGDLTNSGYLDMYVGTGAPDYRSIVPNQMLYNEKGKKFLDVTTAGGFGSIQKGHAVSFADFDNDGDQDLYVNLGGAYSGDVFPNALFMNPGNENSWISIQLEGTKSNRSAIGAKVRLFVIDEDGEERTYYHTCNSGGTFGCNSLRLEVGLGKAREIQEIQVNWPNGENGFESFGASDLNCHIRLVEGASSAQKIKRESFQLKLNNLN